MNHDPRTLEAFEREVGLLARRIRWALAERAHAVHPDLQSGAYLVLATVWRSGSLRAATLVETLGLDKAAVSRHVQHLLDLGLVTKTRDPEDGRAALLSVAPGVATRLEQMAGERSAALDARLADWSAAELDALVATLARYNRTMDSSTSDDPPPSR
jgi:DNA-binding MarR family transcriptional regulator